MIKTHPFEQPIRKYALLHFGSCYGSETQFKDTLIDIRNPPMEKVLVTS